MDHRHVQPQLSPNVGFPKTRAVGFVRKSVGLGLTARLLPMTLSGFNRSACVESHSPRLIGSRLRSRLRAAWWEFSQPEQFSENVNAQISSSALALSW